MKVERGIQGAMITADLAVQAGLSEKHMLIQPPEKGTDLYLLLSASRPYSSPRQLITLLQQAANLSSMTPK